MSTAVLRTLLLREPSNADLMIMEARRLRATGAMPAALARFGRPHPW
ncbi:MAG: hypothetical protein IPO52_15975 [Gemmatimonadetes bacterium]|nr:hypothetical protein [Gemmatimonadota bacterium]